MSNYSNRPHLLIAYNYIMYGIQLNCYLILLFLCKRLQSYVITNELRR
jgi:hypothetical protein